MELFRSCINVLKSCKSADLKAKSLQLDGLEALVRNHEKFVKFVSRVSIEELVKNSTLNEIERSKDEEADFLVELSNAATQPNVVDLIARNLLRNLGIDENLFD